MTQEEIWVSIPEHPEYMVSNMGRIKRLAGTRRGRMNALCGLKEKILSPHHNGKGYKRVVLRPDRLPTYVHRIVASAFIPNPDNKEQVNHINLNPSDNRVENLEWVTRLENAHHAVVNGALANRKNVAKLGEAHPNSKLTAELVVKIREMSKQHKCTHIAKIMNINPGTVWGICNGTAWKHVPAQ